MAKYSLIGGVLGHSYSQIIHNDFGYDYDLVTLAPDRLKDFVRSFKYDAFNVTIPYKVAVIDSLDEIDESAKLIGSVNTVVNRDGRLIGYNTDISGMKYAFNFAGIRLQNANVMILGSGGTYRTAKALADISGAKKVVEVSRSGIINYTNYKDFAQDIDVLINTTPVGMYPNVDEKIVDLDVFTHLKGVFDAIYNPLSTNLILSAKNRGIVAVNGLLMLVAQAKFARDLFFDNFISDDIIVKEYDNLTKRIRNIALIGMPSCGKSVIGKILAQKLSREFIDTDDAITIQCKQKPSVIIKEKGEATFRKVETQIISKYAREKSQVISTGGGVVTIDENILNLRRNSLIIYVRRNLDKLVATDDRPLSNSKEALKKLYDIRREKYEKAADIVVDNESDIDSAVNSILEKIK